jgi:hypothetical protein
MNIKNIRLKLGHSHIQISTNPQKCHFYPLLPIWHFSSNFGISNALWPHEAIHPRVDGQGVGLSNGLKGVGIWLGRHFSALLLLINVSFVGEKMQQKWQVKKGRKQKEEEEEGRKRRKKKHICRAESFLGQYKRVGKFGMGDRKQREGTAEVEGKGRNGGNEIKFTHRGVKKGKKCHVFFWTRGGEYAGHQHIPTTI